MPSLPQRFRRRLASDEDPSAAAASDDDDEWGAAVPSTAAAGGKRRGAGAGAARGGRGRGGADAASSGEEYEAEESDESDRDEEYKPVSAALVPLAFCLSGRLVWQLRGLSVCALKLIGFGYKPPYPLFSSQNNLTLNTPHTTHPRPHARSATRWMAG